MLNNLLLMSVRVEVMRIPFLLSVLPGSFRRRSFNRDFFATFVVFVSVAVAVAAVVAAAAASDATAADAAAAYAAVVA